MANLCFVLPGLDAGGVENYVLRYLRYYPDVQDTVVMVRSNEKGDLFSKFEQTKAEIRFLPVGYFNPLQWYRVYTFFKTKRFSTVCDFGGNFAGITLLLARWAGVGHRIAFYRRSSDAFKPTHLKTLYNSWMNRLVYRHATHILSNSQHAIEVFFGHRALADDRFRVIRNGLERSSISSNLEPSEAKALLKLPADQFIVGHVGRYDPSKNHETIFKVAASLKRDHSNVLFVFAGKGTDSKSFKARLKEYDIEDVCIGLGLLESVPHFYRALDLFYFPSVTEGQPNALIEAMMARVPILTSSIEPIKEILPAKYGHMMIDPMEVSLAGSIIRDLKSQLDLRDRYRVGDDVIDLFDATQNFQKFRKVLVEG